MIKSDHSTMMLTQKFAVPFEIVILPIFLNVLISTKSENPKLKRVIKHRK